jgi:type III secretory pathway component EscR
MDFLISLFENEPGKTFAYFAVIITIFSLVIIGASFYYDYLNKTKLIKKISSFERSLKDMVEEFRSFEHLFSEQKKSHEEYKFILSRVEQEISRLADSLGGDRNITSAISLAKEGYTVNEISEKTGIPIEEIEPIVKYHGNS